MAERAATAHAAARVLLGGGDRDGTPIWVTSNDKAAAPGLHALEETNDSEIAGIGSNTEVSGVVRPCGDGDGRVRGGVGVNTRPNACCDERRDTGLGEPAARLA